ncbi:4-Hydroxybutyrate CoA-transferase domain protein [Clostridioides difficile Y155]|nr:4-Hydroxybutyrate CoA-transferase domain protein [Clostridioides difficile]EQI21171.1 4-Hydroxybutyrate CoA-transferase domain protein [Clostridioides difficile Y155]
MSWQELYQSKLCSATEAVKQIKNGDTVVFAHCVGEPPALVEL